MSGILVLSVMRLPPVLLMIVMIRALEWGEEEDNVLISIEMYLPMYLMTKMGNKFTCIILPLLLLNEKSTLHLFFFFLFVFIRETDIKLTFGANPVSKPSPCPILK